VLDVIRERLPDSQQWHHESARDEAITTADALRQVAMAISCALDCQAARVIRALTCELGDDPDLTRQIDERFTPHDVTPGGALVRG